MASLQPPSSLDEFI